MGNLFRVKSIIAKHYWLYTIHTKMSNTMRVCDLLVESDENALFKENSHQKKVWLI